MPKESKSELSKGWVEAPIEDLLARQKDGKLIHQGWSPQCYREITPLGSWGVLKTTAIQDGYFLECENKHLPNDKPPRERLEVKVSDFLLTCAGPRNRCGVTTLVRAVRPKLLISGKMYRFRVYDELIAPSYLEAWLRTYRATQFIDSIKTGISESGLNITQTRFKPMPVWVAPFAEQKRIVEKLDSFWAQVEIIQARLNTLPDIIKRFRQSVLAAAVSGKLTQQWREENNDTITSSEILDSHYRRWIESKLKEFKEKNKSPKNDSWKLKYKKPELVEMEKCWEIPKQWSWTTIDSISFVTKLAGFEYTKYVEYSDDGDLAVIKAENVGLNGFKHKRYSYVLSENIKHLTRSKISGDEVLVVFVGAGVGQVARVPQNKNYFLGPNVAVVKNISGLYLSQYMEMYLRSEVGKQLLLSFSKGAAQPSLSMGQIRKTSIPVPTISEQNEIVRLVEQYFALADTLEKHLANAKQRVDNLTQSILAKAFRGELVPQDPNDEPADKLLARIKSARAEAEALAKAAKAANKKTAKAKGRTKD